MKPKSYLLLLLLFLIIKEVSAQKYDAEIVKYSTFCEVGTNRLVQTDSVAIQINNRAGDKYTEISIHYSKNEKVSDLDGWIENSDGTKVRSLKNNEVVDQSAISQISLYEDNFKKSFQLKHNVYPYRVIYTFKTCYKNYVTIAHWTPIVHCEIPTKEASLKVKIPRDFEFKKFINNISEPKVDTTRSDILLEWKALYDKPIKYEIYSQPEKKYPFVVIIPLSFKYGVEGSFKNWVSYGNWQYKLIRGLDDLPEDEENTISSLIKGIKDKKEIVKILYHYLQDHTHYINVSIALGGYKPYPASYVAENKYGDCKALSNYMKAMLSYAGIESFYVNVYASGQPREVIKELSAPQFNHIVLAVPINHDTIWLENTSNTNPFGYMGIFTQNREALLVAENKSRLVRIPPMRKEDNHVSNKLQFELNTNGTAKVTLNNSYKGREFEKFNGLHAFTNDKEKDTYICEYTPFDNYEVVNWKLKKLHRDTARIELHATLNLNKYLKPLGNEFCFSLYPTRIPAFPVVADRVLPVVLPYPIFLSDTLIYKFPTGYILKSEPDSVMIKSIFGNYDLKFKILNGIFRAVKRFELFPGEYSIEQYPDFYAFIQSVKEKDDKEILIRPIN
jgi:hypothetical protein